ncbi:HNH endonuclease [Vibrio japonicus]|uniref:HNH endonuclease n=1 Tax=Vibrio japonicus TaxID=1824638 RepID=A0ABY5LJU3_9VIBR|nr:HNH endonuclease [Vibrio japonicus]UUM32349.1 HNH endonuclease [Vibrio japonicus]
MDWVIYVAEATTKNLEIGLKKGIWGHKKIFSTVNTDKIKKGDTLFFVHHLTLMKDEDGKSVPGFPRVGPEHYNGAIATLIKAEVTTDFYVDDVPVWPDDVYPNRYHFKVLEKYQNIPFGEEFFSREFVDAVQKSTMRKGLAIEFALGADKVFSPKESTDLEIFEGAPVYRRHLVRERKPEIIRAKKAQVKLSVGKLICEACEFDFEKTYGERGEDFIECHHQNPLSDSEGQNTKLEDLALLCSNCHRIIHRSRPWITVSKLKEIIDERARAITEETAGLC